MTHCEGIICRMIHAVSDPPGPRHNQIILINSGVRGGEGRARPASRVQQIETGSGYWIEEHSPTPNSRPFLDQKKTAENYFLSDLTDTATFSKD